MKKMKQKSMIFSETFISFIRFISTNVQLEKNQVRWSGVTLKDFKNERNIVIIVINSDSKVS